MLHAAKLLGLPLIPPYAAASTKGVAVMNGVNYASGAASSINYPPYFSQQEDTWAMFTMNSMMVTIYAVIDFSKDKRVHCFPEMIVGLNIHDELSVKPEIMKDGKSIKDFRELVSKAYAPILSSMPQTKSITKEQSFPLRDSRLVSQLGKPKLVVISREKSRKMMNQKAIVKLAKMVGVHGAAMTHLLFMRPGSVFIQIVSI
ncbi:hypothetical protein SUGI_0860620 [Cryptomeria japonica]|nr:hypothetical protein SUGI_0860620 [Cryptomeria japonica]